MTKSSIINSVPVNAGDELLLLSALKVLESSGFKVNSVHSNQRELAKKVLPSAVHEWDLEQANSSYLSDYVPRPVTRKAKQFGLMDAGARWRFWQTPRYQKSFAALDSASWVFSSAGGYLNSRYGYAGRLATFEKLLERGKNLVLLPQSIGPFDPGQDHSRLKSALSGAKAVLVRDNVSLEYLSQIGFAGPNLHRWPDFGLVSDVLEDDAPPHRPPDGKRRVMVCVRSWGHGVQKDSIEGKFIRLVEDMLALDDVEIVFASTCQGVGNYVDDGKIMSHIWAGISAHLRSRTTVAPGHLHAQAFHDLARTCDCYVGMRLHGAIMAMHAGIPALAVGYEEKSAEIFRELELEDCCMDVRDPVGDMLKKCRWFLANISALEVRSRAALAREDYALSHMAARLKTLTTG